MRLERRPPSFRHDPGGCAAIRDGRSRASQGVPKRDHGGRCAHRQGGPPPPLEPPARGNGVKTQGVSVRATRNPLLLNRFPVVTPRRYAFPVNCPEHTRGDPCTTRYARRLLPAISPATPLPAIARLDGACVRAHSRRPLVRPSEPVVRRRTFHADTASRRATNEQPVSGAQR